MISRRSAISRILAGACVPGIARSIAFAAETTPAEPALAGWTSEWDQQLLAGLLKQMNQAYDPAARMIGSYRGPEYNYQSTLRGTTVHPIRDTFEYALALLEEGTETSRTRSFEILDRTISLQDSDPSSKWFGLWSYYLEEPLPRMAAVDFNWADFNGSTLLLILFRHRERLPSSVVASVSEAIRRAAISIRRRDITPYYTNIIAQGSYVVLAAAETLHDNDLLEYGLQRMRRWAVQFDKSGSFAEYNSPAYTPEVIRHMTSIRMFVRNAEARKLAERFHDRAWQQLAAHWHAPTLQLAGPMARVYSNDIGSPLWLQKGIGNAVIFESLAELSKKGGPISTGLLDLKCPDDLRKSFVKLEKRHQHREVFIEGEVLLDTLIPHPASPPLIPVQGTTLLTPSFALGSANRSDFWVQRRPLLAYWGDAARPPHVLQLRVVKNDYDFSSASFYSVQQQGAVLGAIGFRTDGGDKHPLIERIKDGTFEMQQMYVQFQFANWNPKWTMLVGGKPLQQTSAEIPLNSRISIDVGSCRIGIQIRAAAFHVDAASPEETLPPLRWTQAAGKATLELTLFKRAEDAPFQWQNLQDAGVAFTCIFDDSATGLQTFDQQCRDANFHAASTNDQLKYQWSPPAAAGAASLELDVRRGVHPFAEMESGYAGRIDGKPVPMERLDAPSIA